MIIYLKIYPTICHLQAGDQESQWRHLVWVWGLGTRSAKGRRPLQCSSWSKCWILLCSEFWFCSGPQPLRWGPSLLGRADRLLNPPIRKGSQMHPQTKCNQISGPPVQSIHQIIHAHTHISVDLAWIHSPYSQGLLVLSVTLSPGPRALLIHNSSLIKRT